MMNKNKFIRTIFCNTSVWRNVDVISGNKRIINIWSIVNHENIILNRKNHTSDNEHSNDNNDPSTSNRNQQNDIIKDKSESFEEPKTKRSSRKKSKKSYIPYNPRTYKDLNTFPKVLTRGMRRKNLKTKRIPPSKLKMDDVIISAEDANKISQAIKANPNLKKSQIEKNIQFFMD